MGIARIAPAMWASTFIFRYPSLYRCTALTQQFIIHELASNAALVLDLERAIYRNIID